MSSQEQPTSSAQESNDRFPNPLWDGTAPRIGKVQAHHYWPQNPPGFILIDPTDKKGPLKDESGIPTSHDFTGARRPYDGFLKVDGNDLQAALDRNDGKEIRMGDYVRLEYLQGKLIEITKDGPSKGEPPKEE